MNRKLSISTLGLAVALAAYLLWPGERPPTSPGKSTAPGYDTQGYPLEPPVISPEPTPVPEPPAPAPVEHWGPCAWSIKAERDKYEAGRESARLNTEDRFLRAVLASQVGDDPLFGGTVAMMEAAECAALRWRLAGR